LKPKSQWIYCLASGIIFSFIGIFLLFLDITTSKSSTAILGIIVLPSVALLFFVIGLSVAYVITLVVNHKKKIKPRSTKALKYTIIGSLCSLLLIPFLPYLFMSVISVFIGDPGPYMEKRRQENHKRNIYDEYTRAIEDLNKSIALNPNDANTYYRRGIAKIKLQNYTHSHPERTAKGELQGYMGAIQDYNKAIELDPNFSEAYSNRAAVKYYSMKDYRGAIQDYNKVIELNPKSDHTYYRRGVAKHKLKDYKGAMQDYNKAIEIDPKYAEIYYNRGVAKGLLGDKRGAIEDFNKAIELNPKDVKAYAGRGGAKIFLGQKDSGCLDLSKAGELGYFEAYEVIKKHCN